MTEQRTTYGPIVNSAYYCTICHTFVPSWMGHGCGGTPTPCATGTIKDGLALIEQGLALIRAAAEGRET